MPRPNETGYVTYKAMLGWIIGSGAGWASLVVTVVFISWNVHNQAPHKGSVTQAALEREVTNIKALLDRDHESLNRVEEKVDKLLAK